MTLVKWTTPKVVRRYQWNISGKRELLLITGLSFKWTLLLGLPTWWAVAHFAPMEEHRIALRLLSVPFLFLLQIVPHLLLYTCAGSEYRADLKGLCYSVGGRQRRILWRHIRAWRITDHPRIAGIRVLAVEAFILRRWRTRTFPLNPRAVDEARLRRLLYEHIRMDC